MAAKKGSKKLIIVLAAMVLLIAAIFVVVMVTGGNSGGDGNDNNETTTNSSSATGTQEEEKGPINPLTGMSGFDAQGKRPVAVMINNSAPARPQWGLCTPDIVVEGVTEAGITRMLWLYADVNDMPDKVGSLRSARHDFVEIAEGLDALFVHWGGSKYAYNAINGRDVDHLDGMAYTQKYFFRDTERTNVSIEHRGYTTGEAVKKGFEKLNLRQDIDSKYSSPFAFADDVRTPDGGACKTVDIVFSKYCNHTFTYNTSDSLYYNNINGSPMKDADGKQMAVKNVIILYCGISSMGDDAGCIDMNLTSGSGVLLSNGAYENITWEKGSASDMLKLYSADGKELQLNAGKSYIGLVPNSNKAQTVIG
ncbi:MAG: DUF3048 domain-containing protein [Clostridia bacterium]|nr:DUF3048 domain-containing protein [Clostridia bacterium]